MRQTQKLAEKKFAFLFCTHSLADVMSLPQVVKCQPKSKLLRRQKSASEFDGRVAEQGGEDDSK